jgi:hypothetical protein
MTARQGLQREAGDRKQQVAAPSAFQVRVQECERERDPLHGRHVQLAEAEEAGWGKREDQTADEGAGQGDVQTSSQHERAGAAQHAGNERRKVHRQHQVARQPDDWRRQERAANQVLRIGERAGKRVVDVRVEDSERLVEKRMRVPGKRPDIQVRVRHVGDDLAAGRQRKRQAPSGMSGLRRRG